MLETYLGAAAFAATLLAWLASTVAAPAFADVALYVAGGLWTVTGALILFAN